MKIDGPGQADIIKKEQKDSYVVVVYRPLSPGEYDIHIKNKGRAIHGSPFSAKISGLDARCFSTAWTKSSFRGVLRNLSWGAHHDNSTTKH